ncbi:MAG: potassium-transporting ATPase subunit KdpA, partial [Verrucomicrobiaceae bacterium]
MNPLLYSFLFVAVVALLAWPVGKWLTWTVRTNALDPWFTRLLGPGITRGTGWKSYFLHLLGFNAVMFALTWTVLANQQHLPLNPDGMKGVPWHLVFNTTVSFVTNTNLQHYSGEATFSYLSQLTLMWLQFTSAATGIAAFVALARGVAGSRDFGNFTHDTARILFLFLVPLATIWALTYSVSGVPM